MTYKIKRFCMIINYVYIEHGALTLSLSIKNFFYRVTVQEGSTNNSEKHNTPYTRCNESRKRKRLLT